MSASKLDASETFDDNLTYDRIKILFGRFQEIAQSLDQALTGPSVAQRGLAKAEENNLGLALSSSGTLWECLQRCWKDDVYIDAISDKFLRLTLQLLSRSL